MRNICDNYPAATGYYPSRAQMSEIQPDSLKCCTDRQTDKFVCIEFLFNYVMLQDARGVCLTQEDKKFPAFYGN